ncbi:hypothetical protein CPS_0529 [Colwellia psychrerythraea 34H]|uniref:Uncharacterized protein n=1 Tax=Colwellia psychrerythraea (strain 34H / ATCC BAA-681) TaxID=167879 RepID=Q489H7_COLP3|nr:hypothetical protein CPS_0529 [Colwellia psychrerythraea 34H]
MLMLQRLIDYFLATQMKGKPRYDHLERRYKKK